MIKEASGTGLEIFRAGHEEEQECLFYVALSRAEDRLFVYAATENAAGRRREPSEFVVRIGLSARHLHDLGECPPPPETLPIPIDVDGTVRVSGFQIGLYESCPRRFFYTHVIDIGGRRTPTAFLQMHDAVRAVSKEIVSRGPSVPDKSEIGTMIDRAFAARGLTAHGYAAEFRDLAAQMVDYFVSQRAASTPEAPEPLGFSIDAGEIVVLPDDVLVQPGRGRIFRRLHTGHYREKDVKELEAAAFAIAVQHHAAGAEAQVLHLSDRRTSAVAISARPLQTQRKHLEAALSGIRAGQFAPEASLYTCPNCPAFFVCGPVPSGAFRKKFDGRLPVDPSRTD